MPILGLGTNIGDRLQNLALAVRSLSVGESPALRDLRISAVYESEALLLPGSPADWNLPFFNIAVSGKTSLSPIELLGRVKSIEQEIGRKDRGRWGPREIDIDILAWSSLVFQSPDLEIPHRGLIERSFALLPLLDVAPRFQYPGLPANWHPDFVKHESAENAKAADADIQRKFSSYLSDLPLRFCSKNSAEIELVAVVNLTPDSFSDGGRFTHTSNAEQHILELLRRGASVIDIGAEST